MGVRNRTPAREAEETDIERHLCSCDLAQLILFSVFPLLSSPLEGFGPQMVPYLGQTSLPGGDGVVEGCPFLSATPSSLNKTA